VVSLVSDFGVTDTSGQHSLNEFRLFPNFPNPFNRVTNFDYYLPAPGKVRITIYSATGEAIRTIVNDKHGAGLHRVSWNGTDVNDQAVASGVYVYSLTTDDHTESKKMLLLK
jgi:hypothetical protein